MTALCHLITRFYQRYLTYLASISLLLVVMLILVDRGMAFYVRHEIYTDVQQIPHRPYALVLGTSKYVEKNRINLFYQNRLQATRDLFQQQKVDYILLSGDNRTVQYNEPRTMQKDLRKMGVPAEALYMDFAGFRTLDSVIRASKVFQANSITIVTQKFHCERALFIAKAYDINAICLAADTPESSTMVRARELLARVLALFDVLLQKAPHFLGSPEPLPSAPLEIPVEHLSSQ